MSAETGAKIPERKKLKEINESRNKEHKANIKEFSMVKHASAKKNAGEDKKSFFQDMTADAGWKSSSIVERRQVKALKADPNTSAERLHPLLCKVVNKNWSM